MGTARRRVHTRTYIGRDAAPPNETSLYVQLSLERAARTSRPPAAAAPPLDDPRPLLVPRLPGMAGCAPETVNQGPHSLRLYVVRHIVCHMCI